MPGTVLDIYLWVLRMDSLKDRIREIEKEEIINALKRCNWVMAKAARSLGITERMIGYKMRKYRITREVRRDEKKNLQKI
jgi:transcriptional regulator with GAF, ATPase, and Fis domain